MESSEIEVKDDGGLQVIDIRNIGSFLAIDEKLDDEIDIFNMTSLSNYMFGHSNCQSDEHKEEDNKLHRLSLAYERLHTIPKIILQEIAEDIQILDISHNEFDNLDFLVHFKNLTNLICDHNNISTNTNIPAMPKLELLWLNHCKIDCLYPWTKKLQLSCPNLKYLSLMGNPGVPSYFNNGSFYEFLHYRLFIISLFSKLVYLDDRVVIVEQRQEAERVYHKPLMERLVMKTQSSIPVYLRQFSDTVSDFFIQAPAPFEKNVIV